MGYAYKNTCHSTALLAAQASCRTDYPQLEVTSATVSVTTSCLSVDQTGLTGDLVRLNLARSSSNAAPVAYSAQVRVPTCSDLGTSGATQEPIFWALLVVIGALGYLGGRHR